jgi:hypothetical protein
MDVEYSTLWDDLETGMFRQALEAELTRGFRAIHDAGERLPTASHYASQIAEIISGNAPEPISTDLAFHLYQEILIACERARAAILGEPPVLH